MIKLLADKSGVLAFLINASVFDDYVKCGCAILRGGLRTVDLVDGFEVYRIMFPEEVQKSATWEIYMSPNDDVKFDRII